MAVERFGSIIKNMLQRRSQSMFEDDIRYAADKAQDYYLHNTGMSEDKAAENAIAAYSDDVMNNFEITLALKDGVVTVDYNDRTDTEVIKASNWDELISEITGKLKDAAFVPEEE